LFKLAALSRRITRLYVYQWTGARAPRRTRFDAGITNVHGKPRPAYCVIYRQLRHKRSCPYRTVKN